MKLKINSTNIIYFIFVMYLLYALLHYIFIGIFKKKTKYLTKKEWLKIL